LSANAARSGVMRGPRRRSEIRLLRRLACRRQTALGKSSARSSSRSRSLRRDIVGNDTLPLRKAARDHPSIHGARRHHPHVISGMTFDGATTDPVAKAVRDALIGFKAATKPQKPASGPESSTPRAAPTRRISAASRHSRGRSSPLCATAAGSWTCQASVPASLPCRASIKASSPATPRCRKSFLSVKPRSRAGPQWVASDGNGPMKLILGNASAVVSVRRPNAIHQSPS
jgi:hypothetical protein